MDQSQPASIPRRPLKTLLLYGLIGSVVCAALLAIFFVIRNSWQWIELRLLLTTVIIACASLFGLACDATRSPLRRNWLRGLGLITTAVAAVLCLIVLWLDVDTEPWIRLTICSVIIAVASVHMCLLSIAKLARRFRWVLFLAYQLILGLAFVLCTLCFSATDTSEVWQLIGVLMVVVAAISLIIPILHRISRIESAGDDLATPLELRDEETIDAEIAKLRRQIDQLERLKRQSQAGRT